MTRVLVAWEDEYFEGLKLLVRKRLPALAPDRNATPPLVDWITSRGNGKFELLVSKTWPNVRGRGLPGNPGVLDHLVCVVDADKLCDLMPTLPAIPQRPEQIPGWHATAERAWHAKVRGWGGDSVPAGSVHGLVLRWSRESALLAGFDKEPFREHLQFDIENADVSAFLQKGCAPSPLALPEAGIFSDTFAHPHRCLERAFEKQKLRVPSKNDAVMDDVLRALARDYAEVVCTRVPDLDALARFIWRLSLPAPPPPPPAAPDTPTPKRRRGKKP